MSRQVGIVLQVDDEPSIMREYVHTVRTKNGELKVVGCGLELVPAPQTNLESASPTRSGSTAASDGQNDSKFIRLAIEEARKNVSENDNRVHPKVGAVVVKGGQLLSTAYRGEQPGNHAEYVALEKKLRDEDVTGATVYTTLEPCTTRTHPKIPCAERLVERKVARVVIGMLDLNPDILGRGDQILSDAGIEVQLFPPELRAQVEDMNREFIRSQKDRQAQAKVRTTDEDQSSWPDAQASFRDACLGNIPELTVGALEVPSWESDSSLFALVLSWRSQVDRQFRIQRQAINTLN